MMSAGLEHMMSSQEKVVKLLVPLLKGVSWIVKISQIFLYNIFIVSSENLVLHQNTIPSIIPKFFFKFLSHLYMRVYCLKLIIKLVLLEVLMTCINLSVLVEGVSKIVCRKEGVVCAQMLVLHCSCFRRGKLTFCF